MRLLEVLMCNLGKKVKPMESYNGDCFADLFCTIEGKGYQIRISRAPQYDDEKDGKNA